MGLPSFNLLIKNATQAVVVCKGDKVMAGEDQKKLVVLQREENDGLSVVCGQDGNIEDVDYDSVIQAKYNGATFNKVIDATEQVVMPGLIDGHTHPVWAGDRVHEFAMKCGKTTFSKGSGVSPPGSPKIQCCFNGLTSYIARPKLDGKKYMDIHKQGGGIHFTVEKTRAASEDELYQLLRVRLMSMLRAGTTLAECKSGYGLNCETEIKMLRVLERAREELPIEISSTYCGAHAVPKGMSEADAVKDIMDVQLPAIKEMMDKKLLNLDSIDVFCEAGAFGVESTWRILCAGEKMGLLKNYHGDELTPMQAAELAEELGATAVSHLEEISTSGIEAMSRSGTIAVLCPTTAYALKLNIPPARKMINEGLAIALGSDFNPNVHCLSMPMVLHKACVMLGMTMPEALVGATINAAASLGKSKTHGSLEKGKVANMIIIDAPRWEHLIYQYGCHDQIIKHVIVKGNLVHTRPF